MASSKYNGTHFIWWEDKKWYEGSITREKLSDGKYEIFYHDGSQYTRSPSQISVMGQDSVPGDTVIAYWDTRDHAFLAKHAATHHSDGSIFVDFSGGYTAWIERKHVHKFCHIV